MRSARNDAPASRPNRMAGDMLAVQGESEEAEDASRGDFCMGDTCDPCFMMGSAFLLQRIDMDYEYESELSEAISDGLGNLAKAVTPLGALAGTDAVGGQVESLTEAVMGVTAGLVRIADAISDLAEAVREREA